MNEKIIEAKNALISMMCEEAKKLIENSAELNKICKLGWVDYIDDNLVQH